MKFATRLEPRVGGPIHIDFASQGSLDGVVCNVEPPNLLIYTWGDSLVTWDLEGDGDRNHAALFSHWGSSRVAGWNRRGLARVSRPAGRPSDGEFATGPYRELKGRYERDSTIESAIGLRRFIIGWSEFPSRFRSKRCGEAALARRSRSSMQSVVGDNWRSALARYGKHETQFRRTWLKAPLDIVEIMEILPHRYPFLMIDRVIEIERKKRIVAIKNVTVNEPYFQGHFPGFPIMPGVMLLEAMAQAGGIL